MDYYKILNIKEDASLKQIEQAYQDLLAFYNPENNVSKLAYKKYREVIKAYNVLKEEKQKEIYTLSLKEKKVVEEKEESGNIVDIDEFKLNTSKNKPIEEYKDVLVEDTYTNYLHLKYKIPYLYYLCNSEYLISFEKENIVSSNDVCQTCLGIGKVKSNEKIGYCPNCKGSGKEIIIEKEIVKLKVQVEEKMILEEYRTIVEFDFFDKDLYVLNGNEITLKKLVSDEEYYNGIKYVLKNNNEELIIEEKEFKQLFKTYIFEDKVINIEYILSSYAGLDLYGVIVTDENIIYLNPKNYTYSNKASDEFTYKVEINNSKVIIENLGKKGFNSKNGNLILNVIKVKNNNDMKIFFDKKIKKVSPSLFKYKGEYNKHYFTNKKQFDYDNNYIYIPSLAYRLQLKNFTIFKLIFIASYLLIPLIMLLIFGFGYMFFISSFIGLFLAIIVVNLLMEVKI